MLYEVYKTQYLVYISRKSVKEEIKVSIKGYINEKIW